MLTGGAWLYLNRISTPVKQNYVQDIAPGGNKATLTLANGETIQLSKTIVSFHNEDNLSHSGYQTHRKRN